MADDVNVHVIRYKIYLMSKIDVFGRLIDGVDDQFWLSIFLPLFTVLSICFIWDILEMALYYNF